MQDQRRYATIPCALAAVRRCIDPHTLEDPYYTPNGSPAQEGCNHATYISLCMADLAHSAHRHRPCRANPNPNPNPNPNQASPQQSASELAQHSFPTLATVHVPCMYAHGIRHIEREPTMHHYKRARLSPVGTASRRRDLTHGLQRAPTLCLCWLGSTGKLDDRCVFAVKIAPLFNEIVAEAPDALVTGGISLAIISAQVIGALFALGKRLRLGLAWLNGRERWKRSRREPDPASEGIQLVLLQHICAVG